jgi:RNA polymerase sigma-70 factor, ECF subfamily
VAGISAGEFEVTVTVTVSEDFTGLTGRYRGELLAHCYRMLGSAGEAEDLVQETYLRAWRSFDGFEGRASVRTWLYRIATNVCLPAIERRSRRPLPSGLGGPADDPEAPLVAGPEVPWLQPYPGTLLAGKHEDPAAAAATRAGIRLAFVAALQYLSARQRAVLILRDVLEWPAAEVAELLGTTTTAVNSGLRRARAQLAQALPAEDELAEPAEPGRRALLDRFAAAIENADASALAELLRQDAALEMPPLLTWFTGRQAVTRFVASHLLTEPGRLRLVPVMANGQPAFAVYQREPGGGYHAHAVLVLTVTVTGIARIVSFQNVGLFESFDLPQEYRAARPTPAHGPVVPPMAPLSRGRELLETAVSYALATGAIEVTVHGWDILVACGASRPVPPGLAAVLLPIVPLLITPGTRPGLFADPVRLPVPASPGDQLVAFLGRQPRPAAAPGPGGA